METVALSEWHLDPEAIFETWTEEKLKLLLERRNQRVQRLNRIAAGEPEEEVGIKSMEQLRRAGMQRELAARATRNK